jgi:MarR family transcriptional regulator, organic hydroperoxide resistance regulator
VENVRQETAELARSLLGVMPKIVRRVIADVPLEDEPEGLEKYPNWRDVTELRATPGQISLLRVLVERERCTMQELAGHLGVAPSTVTAMVKRLLAQGYIERTRGDTDWRTVWIKPTERGRMVVVLFDCAQQASLQRRLSQLSDDERTSLVAALPALRHLLEV